MITKTFRWLTKSKVRSAFLAAQTEPVLYRFTVVSRGIHPKFEYPPMKGIQKGEMMIRAGSLEFAPPSQLRKFSAGRECVFSNETVSVRLRNERIYLRKLDCLVVSGQFVGRTLTLAVRPKVPLEDVLSALASVGIQEK